MFPAKLLLFGEHVLLLGATALAVPVPAFGGQWAWRKEKDRHHERLLQLARSEALQNLEMLDSEHFERDLGAGLFFQSNIPTGYGLGSSGALCAAIYDRYARQKTTDPAALKRIFGQMESFFHGSSSGIDPLTSYLDAAILIQHKTEVKAVAQSAWEGAKPVTFLIDSGLPRRTGPLVEWFLTQSRESAFSERLSGTYLPAHEAMVQGWLSADIELFWANLRRVSAFQFENFPPMIPQTLFDLWEESLQNQCISLKICGAGGGGFVLGFAQDAQIAQSLANGFKIMFPL